jgi:hypothetical protein
MSTKYEPPEVQKKSFHCPHCGVYARQYWQLLFWSPTYERAQSKELKDVLINFCNSCDQYSIWREGKMVYPLSSAAPMPADAMPGDVREDYLEARDIVGRSPRSAAALLRLAVQKLMPHLNESGKNLNDDIANLVKKGLPAKIQMGLDSLRVIGNNAVHPGQIDLKDDIETATSLFELLNMTIDVMIAQPKRVAAIYEKIPDSTKKAIEKRDRPPSGDSSGS